MIQHNILVGKRLRLTMQWQDGCKLRFQFLDLGDQRLNLNSQLWGFLVIWEQLSNLFLLLAIK